MRHIAVVLAALATTAPPAAAEDCAEGLQPFEDATGTDCVPEDPQRIVSLHDISITLSLAELGARDKIVGSHGRLGPDGPRLRAVPEMFGVTLEGDDIAFLGTFGNLDLEAMAALEPDLIVGRSSDAEIVDRLRAIAPTALIDRGGLDLFEKIAAVAELSATTDRHEELLSDYEARIQEARALIPNASEIDAAVLSLRPESGVIELYENFYALTPVLEAIGIGRADAVEGLLEEVAGSEELSASIELSPERLPGVDSDFLFVARWGGSDDLDTPRRCAGRSIACSPTTAPSSTSAGPGR